MREIRFRAWDLIDKRMIKLEDVANDAWGIIVVHDILKGKNERYIPMQFIGLLDKNGTEIYEGDIITGIDYKGRKIKQPVIWWYSGWYAGYYDPDNETRCVNSLSSMQEMEVVGNIYETPKELGG